MAAQKPGTVDYAKLLRGIPTATRLSLYKTLLEGTGEQPGIAKQFIDRLVEYRSTADMVELRRAYVGSMNGEYTEDVKKAAHEEFAQLLWRAELMRQSYEAIGAELGRLQDAVGEIEGAGTG